MNIRCLFGHDWEYFDMVGEWEQPVQRVCLRCKKHEAWRGKRHPHYAWDYNYDDHLWMDRETYQKYDNREREKTWERKRREEERELRFQQIIKELNL